MTRHALAGNGPKMDLGVPTGWVRELFTTPPSHTPCGKPLRLIFIQPANHPPAHTSSSSHAHSPPSTPSTHHLLRRHLHAHTHAHIHTQTYDAHFFFIHSLHPTTRLLGTDLPSHSRPGFWYTVQPSGSGSDIPSLLQHDVSVMIGFGSKWLSMGRRYVIWKILLGFGFLFSFCIEG
jgi:hypothetical protein